MSELFISEEVRAANHTATEEGGRCPTPRKGPLVPAPAWEASEPQIQFSNQSLLNTLQAPSI